MIDRPLVAREVAVHDLDGDELLEAGLAARVREVDIGHAAGPDSLEYAVSPVDDDVAHLMPAVRAWVAL